VQGFRAGERVLYGEAGTPAMVVGATEARVLVRLAEGAIRRVRPHRLHRGEGAMLSTPNYNARGLSMTATRGQREGAQMALLGDQWAPPEPREASREQIASVFAHWQAATGKTDTHLDEKRRTKIRRALGHYPVEDVIAAVTGWRNDPFYCGENDRGRAYNELTMLLRDAEHIERFRDMARNGPVRRPRTARQAASDVRRRIALG
jgi:hypothetical protein